MEKQPSDRQMEYTRLAAQLGDIEYKLAVFGQQKIQTINAMSEINKAEAEAKKEKPAAPLDNSTSKEEVVQEQKGE